MTDDTRNTRRRGRVLAAAAALVLAAGGAALITVAATGSNPPPPAPPAAAPAPTSPSTGNQPPPSSRPSSPPTSLPREPAPAAATPVEITIPAIDVRAAVMGLGLRGDGSVEVPPHEPRSRAGWYEGSPAPGDTGPSVILGHVDSAEYGPAVFHDLAHLRGGDEILVDRSDGTTATFQVERTVRYPKNAFPTLEVYGNIDHPGLRLITCGGQFDFDAHSYTDNVVTYATLVARQPTR